MASRTKFYVRRFVLEATSPLMISNGGDDPLLDNLLARDANGLPMIPATTLAGAVRAKFEDERTALALFGFQKGNNGARSQVSFTDALAHWKDDRPRDGWHALPREADDKVVYALLRDSPIMRDHVRLNENGTVAKAGKFQRSSVPKGARFGFEVSAWGRMGEADPLEDVAQQIRGTLFLGGAKRSGYGKLECISEGRHEFQLLAGSAPAAYLTWSESTLADHGGFEMQTPAANNREADHWMLRGNIEGPFLIGAPRSDGKGGRQPYSEIELVWGESGGTVAVAKPMLPGSSIKGPLRHRTLFHLGGPEADGAKELVDDLFGAMANADEGGTGKLRFHDTEIENPEEITVAHVGLDRFTGGARDKSGVLFSDKMLWKPHLAIRIDRLEEIPENVARAFDAALADLGNGLLGIGAEWGEGAGVFESCQIAPPTGKASR